MLTHLLAGPLIHTFLHIGRIRNTFSWVCEAAPHTKKHLGTGLVGLQRIHICPVQAIGIQSFTLSNATKREQSRPALFFALAAPLWEGLFCRANNEAVNTRFYCSTRGISLAKDGAEFETDFIMGLKCWVGVQTVGWTDGQMDGGMEAEVVVLEFHMLLFGGLFLHSTFTKQIWRRLFRVERALSAAHYRQCWLNWVYSSIHLIQKHL